MKVSPRRILYVITKANWGGAQRYVYDLAVAVQRGQDEVLVAYGTPGELVERLTSAGLATVQVRGLERDVKGLGDLQAFSNLVRTIHTFHPDVVHTNSSKAGFVAALASRVCRVPNIIFTAHGWAFNENRPGWQKAIFFLFHYITVLSSHITICVSDAAKRDARRMPFVQKKLVTIHNGVGTVPLLPRVEARAKLAPFLKQPFWIGTIAELHPTKQLDVLIDAFAMIPENSGLALVLIGGGSEQTRLNQRIQTLGCKNQIVLCGHVSQASTYLSAFDVFALPSRSEGLAYVLLEAGTASLPVVASRVGGIPEVIQDGETGLLVTSGNRSELAIALETYVSDPELRQKHGNTLAKRVRDHFSIEEMCQKTFALY